MIVDLPSIISSIVSTGPLAAVLCLMWWFERKDKIQARKEAAAVSIKHETYLRENADRLLAFSDEQRKAMNEHDKRIDGVLEAINRR